MFRLLCLNLFAALLLLARATACPSCMQMQMTLSEEVEYASAVVIAQPVPGGSRYRVLRVLRGKLEPGRTIVAPASSFTKPVLLCTIGSEGSPIWSGNPISAESNRVIAFAEELVKLPRRKPGATFHPTRLAFFSKYLGDRENAIADSAYAELAAAPYSQLRSYSRQVGQARLRGWLEDGKTPDHYRSLYYSMLSQTAAPEDGVWLKQKVLEASRRSPVGSLPALLFAYAQVSGQPALAVIRKSYLEGDLTQRMLAVQSLRILLVENSRLRTGILPLLHTQLREIRLGGGLMRDLALCGDWSCADQIYQIMLDKGTYDEARISALRYLVACPRPDIQVKLKKLRSHPPEWCSAWVTPYTRSDMP